MAIKSPPLPPPLYGSISRLEQTVLMGMYHRDTDALVDLTGNDFLLPMHVSRLPFTITTDLPSSAATVRGENNTLSRSNRERKVVLLVRDSIFFSERVPFDSQYNSG
jgi:hypothetical protein